MYIVNIYMQVRSPICTGTCCVSVVNPSHPRIGGTIHEKPPVPVRIHKMYICDILKDM